MTTFSLIFGILRTFWKKCVFQHISGNISGTTAPIGLKFFVRTGFGHRLPHNKLQPLRLKDAEDIRWCGLSAQIGIWVHSTVNPKKLHIRRSMAIKWIFWFTTHQLTMLHAWGMGRSLTHKWKWQFALNFIRFEDIHHSINDWWIKIWFFYKFTDLESVIFESIKVVFNNTFLNPLLGLGKKVGFCLPLLLFTPP